MHTQSRLIRGFLLIAIFLGFLLLLAVMMPINTTTGEREEAEVLSTLTTFRHFIEDFAAKHNGTYPDKRFMMQMTRKSAVDGGCLPLGTPLSSDGKDDFPCKPYIRGLFPMNPRNRSSGVKIVEFMPSVPSGKEGWVYATSNHEIRANSPGAGPSGKDYFDL